ncbi:MAG: efflux RND transporter periplasmic adaptor subunit [Acidobacteriia bacterium]|nr:efflux RND transporter periplasmic adaptor subunit [Terriglobia bacterium]
MNLNPQVARRVWPWLLVFVLVVAAIGCGRPGQQIEYRCPMHPEVVSTHPGDCPVCGMKLVASSPGVAAREGEKPRQALYVCPMDPEVTSNEPGKCPKCGMKLVLAKSNAGAMDDTHAPAGLAPVSIPAAKREMLGLTTGEVATHRFTHHIRAAARIVADESRLFRVTTPAEGWVDKLYVQGIGDVVQKGGPLLELYNIDALNAMRRDLSGFAHFGGQTPNQVKDEELYVRQKVDPTWQPYDYLLQRLRRWGLSDDQIKTLSQAPGDLKRLVIYALTGGFIAEKSVITGQRLQAGDQVFVLADLSRVWAEADLSASDGPLIRSGMTVEIQAPALPGRSFSGHVAAIAPFLEAQTRTQRVRIDLPNPDAVLHPGLPAVAILTVDLGERVAVASSALLRTGERAYAFRVADGDRLVPVVVRAGVTDGDFVEVLEGLASGDRVVTSATFLVDSESAMAAALKAVAGR